MSDSTNENESFHDSSQDPDSFAPLKEALREIEEGGSSPIISPADLTTSSVLTSTPMVYKKLSPYTHRRTVYGIVTGTHTAYSFNARFVQNRLQQVMTLSTAKKLVTVPKLTDPSHFTEWYSLVLGKFAKYDKLFAAYCTLPEDEFLETLHAPNEDDIHDVLFSVESIFSDVIRANVVDHPRFEFFGINVTRSYMEESVAKACEAAANPIHVLKREAEVFAKAQNGDIEPLLHFMMAHGFDEASIWNRVTAALVPMVKTEKNLKKFTAEWETHRKRIGTVNSTAHSFLSELKKSDILLFPSKKVSGSGSQLNSGFPRNTHPTGSAPKNSGTSRPAHKLSNQARSLKSSKLGSTLRDKVILLADYLSNQTETDPESDSEAIDLDVLFAELTNKGNAYSTCSEVFQWDNGSPIHIVREKRFFSTFIDVERCIRGVNGGSTKMTGIGTVQIKLCDGTALTLENVHYIPNCPSNVFSPFAAPEYFLTFPNQDVMNLKTGRWIALHKGTRTMMPVKVTYPEVPVTTHVKPTIALIATTKTASRESDQMDFVDYSDESDDESSLPPSFRAKTPTEESRRWHDRLGHPNAKAFAKLKSRLEIPSSVKHVPSEQCFGCASAKATRLIPKVPSGLHPVTGPFQTLHVDLCGQIDKPSSWDGATYFLTIVDRYSGYLAAYPLAEKLDASYYIRDFLLESRTALRAYHMPSQLRSDNGTEFMAPSLLQFLQSHGTKRMLTNTYSSYQNGPAERANRTIQEGSRTLLAQGNVPLIFWSEAVRMFTALANLTPRQHLNWFTPEDVWLSTPGNPEARQRPDYPPFGCIAMAVIPHALRSNPMDINSVPCAYLGPSSNRAGHRLFHYEPTCVFETGQVTFHDEYYFRRWTPETEAYATLKTKVPAALLPGISLPKLATSKDKSQQAEDLATLKELFQPSIELAGDAMHPMRRKAEDAAEMSGKSKKRSTATRASLPASQSQMPKKQALPRKANPSLSDGVVPPTSGATVQPPSTARTPTETPTPKISSVSVAPLIRAQDKVTPDGTPSTSKLPGARSKATTNKTLTKTVPPAPGGSSVATTPSINQLTSIKDALASGTTVRSMRLRPRNPQTHKVIKPNSRGEKHSYTKNLVLAAPTNVGQDSAALIARILTRSETIDYESSLSSDPYDVLLCDMSGYDLEQSMLNSIDEIDVLYAAEADAFESSYNTDVTPNTYQAAMKSPEKNKWVQACQAEFQAHEENNTWEVVKISDGLQPVGCRWVFVIKDNGVYKARIVAKGYTQIHGIDFEETYSPVINKPVLRTLFALAIKHQFAIHQLDVVLAFLHAELKEEVYVKLPPGFEHPLIKGKRGDYVLKLNKALYGLKQLPLAWNQTMSAELGKHGFKYCVNEPCLFYKGEGASLIMIGLYVDDLLIFGKDEVEIQKVKDILFQAFKMKDMGQVRKFLGINVEMRSHYIKLHMADYIQSALTKFGLEDCNPNLLPWKPSMDLNSLEGDEDEDADITLYRSMVGVITYLVSTCRFDLGWYGLKLSRYLTRPKKKHLEAARSVFRYLKGTVYHGVVYSRDSSSNIIGFSDADFASQLDAGSKSTTGFLINYAGAPVSWKSKLQTIIAVSTLNAEMIAMYLMLVETIWLLNLLGELGFDHKIEMLCDNDGAIKTVHNQSLLDGTKHIRVKVDFVRQKVHSRVVVVSRVDTKENIADMLTKALPYDTFKKHRALLNMRE